MSCRSGVVSGSGLKDESLLGVRLSPHPSEVKRSALPLVRQFQSEETAIDRRRVVHPVGMTDCRRTECLTLRLIVNCDQSFTWWCLRTARGARAGRWCHTELLAEGGGDDRFRDPSGRPGVGAGAG